MLSHPCCLLDLARPLADFAQPRHWRIGQTSTLFVGNLTDHATEAGLHAAFSPVAPVAHVDLRINPPKRPFAFVRFDCVHECVAVYVKLQGTTVAGSVVRLGFGKGGTAQAVWIHGIKPRLVLDSLAELLTLERHPFQEMLLLRDNSAVVLFPNDSAAMRFRQTFANQACRAPGLITNRLMVDLVDEAGYAQALPDAVDRLRASAPPARGGDDGRRPTRHAEDGRGPAPLAGGSHPRRGDDTRETRASGGRNELPPRQGGSYPPPRDDRYSNSRAAPNPGRAAAYPAPDYRERPGPGPGGQDMRPSDGRYPASHPSPAYPPRDRDGRAPSREPVRSDGIRPRERSPVRRPGPNAISGPPDRHRGMEQSRYPPAGALAGPGPGRAEAPMAYGRGQPDTRDQRDTHDSRDNRDNRDNRDHRVAAHDAFPPREPAGDYRAPPRNQRAPGLATGWTGSLGIKAQTVQLTASYLAGDHAFIPTLGPDHTKYTIKQRTKLDTLASVEAQVTSGHGCCLLLARVPAPQQGALDTHFSRYLQDKEAAGLLTLEQSSAYIVPPGDLARRLLGAVRRDDVLGEMGRCLLIVLIDRQG